MMVDYYEKQWFPETQEMFVLPPADFNIFDKMLPKNDVNIYTKTYRYKSYEVSYWNNLLGEKLGNLMQEPEKFVNAYIDELNKFDLNKQIRDDIGNNFVLQYHDKLPEETVTVLKNRYKEMVENPVYQQRIEKMFSGI